MILTNELRYEVHENEENQFWDIIITNGDNIVDHIAVVYEPTHAKLICKQLNAKLISVGRI